jgi:hypothetical protein
VIEQRPPRDLLVGEPAARRDADRRVLLDECAQLLDADRRGSVEPFLREYAIEGRVRSRADLLAVHQAEAEREVLLALEVQRAEPQQPAVRTARLRHGQRLHGVGRLRGTGRLGDAGLQGFDEGERRGGGAQQIATTKHGGSPVGWRSAAQRSERSAPTVR